MTCSLRIVTVCSPIRKAWGSRAGEKHHKPNQRERERAAAGGGGRGRGESYLFQGLWLRKLTVGLKLLANLGSRLCTIPPQDVSQGKRMKRAAPQAALGSSSRNTNLAKLQNLRQRRACASVAAADTAAMPRGRPFPQNKPVQTHTQTMQTFTPGKHHPKPQGIILTAMIAQAKALCHSLHPKRIARPPKRAARERHTNRCVGRMQADYVRSASLQRTGNAGRRPHTPKHSREHRIMDPSCGSCRMQMRCQKAMCYTPAIAT